jgi:hypothetical protein
VTVNRNALDWSISGREALYTGGLPETNTFSAVKPVLKGRFGGASAFITLVTIVCFGVTGRAQGLQAGPAKDRFGFGGGFQPLT